MPSRPTTTLPIKIGDEVFHLTSDDDYLLSMRGSFEPQTVELFRTLVRAGDVAVDIGANVGCTSLLLSGIASKVISFEPSPSTFDLLSRNVAASGRQNIALVNAGLGETDASASIAFNPINRSGGFVSSAPVADHVCEDIKIANGDAQLRAEAAVDFVKIDVEGFELSVLRGLAGTIARHRPVITLELNHWCLNAFQRMSVPDFFDALRAQFPFLYAVGPAGAKDLHDPQAAYHVMHEHITKFEYSALVCTFDEARIEPFMARYVRNPPKYTPPVPDHVIVERLTAAVRVRDAEIERLTSQVKQLDARGKELEGRGKELEGRIEELARAIEKITTDAESEQRRLRGELDAMHRSHSWRVTAPLRAVRRIVS